MSPIIPGAFHEIAGFPPGIGPKFPGFPITGVGLARVPKKSVFCRKTPQKRVGPRRYFVRQKNTHTPGEFFPPRLKTPAVLAKKGCPAHFHEIYNRFNTPGFGIFSRGSPTRGFRQEILREGPCVNVCPIRGQKRQTCVFGPGRAQNPFFLFRGLRPKNPGCVYKNFFRAIY